VSKATSPTRASGGPVYTIGLLWSQGIMRPPAVRWRQRTLSNCSDRLSSSLQYRKTSLLMNSFRITDSVIKKLQTKANCPLICVSMTDLRRLFKELSPSNVGMEFLFPSCLINRNSQHKKVVYCAVLPSCHFTRTFGVIFHKKVPKNKFRELHKEGTYNMYCVPDTVGVIRSRKVRWSM
jgi:hypothetical protein